MDIQALPVLMTDMHMYFLKITKVRSLNFSMVPNQRAHTLIINKNEGDGPIADDQLR